jgi:hypothetical protein
MEELNSHNTMASNPAVVTLSKTKYKKFSDSLGWYTKLLMKILKFESRFTEWLLHGDSRAAIVVQTTPDILVAVYTDEFDCVVILRFPEFVAPWYPLSNGTRLLTINTYENGEVVETDLYPGPGTLNRYSNVHPIIAEFLSDDIPQIEKRKAEISEDEWARTAELAQEYMARPDFKPRNGIPFYSIMPG